MDSYRNSFDSLSDLSQMFASPDHHHHHDDAPPTIAHLFDHQGVVTTNKESERRGKMANMYSILHNLLPTNIASNKQVSREKIVTEAIELIKRLEADKVRLEKLLMIRKNAVVDLSKVTSSSSSSKVVDVSVEMSSRVVVAFEIKFRSRMKTTMTKFMMSLTEIFGKYGAELLTVSVAVADDDGGGEGSTTTTSTTTNVAVTAAIVDGERSGAVVEGINRELLLLVSQV